MSANQHYQDPFNAEFIRTYRTVSFPGQRFLQVLDSELKAEASRVRRGVLPKRAAPVQNETVSTYHIEEIYGYRGRDPRVYYLNPWEFVMYWEVERIPIPKANAAPDDAGSLSIWVEKPTNNLSAAKPGTHYVVNDDGLRDNDEYVVLPNTSRLSAQFRHEWILRRANRPYAAIS